MGRSTAYDRLAATIREKIITGTLKSGDQLPAESEISSNYSVSRNTVREALRTLAGQGLVTIRRGAAGGAFVALPDRVMLSDQLRTSIRQLVGYSATSLANLIELRELLEVPAAESAAYHRTVVDLAAIRSALDASRIESGSSDPFCQFHAHIIAAAKNPLLDVLAGSVLRTVADQAPRQSLPAETRTRLDRDHWEILGHVEAGDQAAARETTRAHLRYVAQLYRDVGVA